MVTSRHLILQKTKKILSLLPLLSGVILSGNTEIALGDQFSWEPVDNAAYYRGRAIIRGKEYRFRTSDTKINIGSGATVTIKAIQATGAMANPDVGVTTIDAPWPPFSTQSNALTPANEATSVAPEPPRQREAIDPDAELDASESAESADKETEIEEIDAPPTPEEIAIEELDSESKSAFDSKPFRVVSISLTAGKESLEAAGGISTYSGSANIGGTSIVLDIDFDQENNNPWAISLKGSGHTFTTTVEESGSSSSASEAVESHRVFHAAFMGSYKLLGRTKFPIKFSAGFGYVELPGMEISDSSTGAAKLKVLSFSGGMVGISAGWKYADNTSVEAEYSMLAASFGNQLKVTSSSAEVRWRYPIVSQIHSLVGLMLQSDTAEYDLSCPETVPTCNSKAKTGSQQTVIQLGADVTF